MLNPLFAIKDAPIHRANKQFGFLLDQTASEVVSKPTRSNVTDQTYIPVFNRVWWEVCRPIKGTLREEVS